MKTVSKIFTTVFLTLALMPVSADTLEDQLQQDIEELTRVYKAHVEKLKKNSKSKGMICTNAKEHHLLAKYDDNQKCIVESCVAGWEPNTDKTACIEKTKTPKANPRTKESNNNNTQEPQVAKVGDPCKRDHAISAKYKKTGKGKDARRDCMVIECEKDYKITSDGKYCEKILKTGDPCEAKDSNAKTAVLRANEDGGFDCIIKTCTESYYKVSSDGQSCIDTKRPGSDCHKEIKNSISATYNENRVCTLESCDEEHGYHMSDDKKSCLNLEDFAKSASTSDECKKTLEDAFADHVPGYYESFYTNIVNQLENKPTPSDMGQNDAYTIMPGIKDKNIKCTYGDKLVKECENAGEILLDLAKLLTKNMKIEDICGINSGKTEIQWVLSKASPKTSTSSQTKTPATTSEKTNSKAWEDMPNISPRSDGFYYIKDFPVLTDVNQIDVSAKGPDGIFGLSKTRGGSVSIDADYRYQFHEKNTGARSFTELAPDTWEVYFKQGKVKGTYKCVNQAPQQTALSYVGRDSRGYKETVRAVDQLGSDTPGNYCWCNTTEPEGIHWTYVKLEKTSTGQPQVCVGTCQSRCAVELMKSDTFRRAMFTTKP